MKITAAARNILNSRAMALDFARYCVGAPKTVEYRRAQKIVEEWSVENRKAEQAHAERLREELRLFRVLLSNALIRDDLDAALGHIQSAEQRQEELKAAMPARV